MAASSKLLLFLFVLITIAQIYLNWTRIAELSAEKHWLETQIQTFRREFHLAERGRSSNGGEQNDLDSLPPIVFVTPTAYRATQKADLTRLAQTLANVRSLFWIVIEDSDTASPFVDDLLIRLNIQSVHLTALTPPEKKANSSEPVNKFPRGVAQRNAALKWIRANLASWTHGVLYFGDDDNTYDWRLFDEMRTIRRVGVWPVGIVGGTLVETPLLHENNGSVRKFSVLWKPNRQFPIDMAGFALNLSLIHANPAVQFSYQSKQGFMETDFLESLKLSLADLEPKAKKCTKVFVWHTRTERANLGKLDMQRLLTRRALSPLERDVLF